MSEDSGKKEQGQQDESKGSHTENEPADISFDPPVYRQRYGVVFEMIKKYSAKKVSSHFTLTTGIPVLDLLTDLM
jgi:hypothetical protein